MKKSGRSADPAGVSRGQGAIEYLMTYGWMILLVIVIGGALYGLGVFNPSTWSSGKRATGFASFQVKDWKLNSTPNGMVTVVLGNKYGESMTVTGVSVNRTGSSANCSKIATTTLAENQETTYTTVNDDCATGLTGGKSYTLDIQIYFTSSGGITHTDSGVITGKVE